MTHAELVNAAFKWVKNNTSCGVVVKELVAATKTGEIPDVIGFGAFNHSVMVECKTSRADFKADFKKPFRIYPEIGVGTQRFYCCPEGLINTEDLPIGWGLLWVTEKSKVNCVYKPYKGNIGEGKGFEKNLAVENSIMYSVLRRMMKEGKS